MTSNSWWIYKGNGKQYAQPPTFPPPPRWRQFKGTPPVQEAPLPADPNPERGARYQASDEEREMVNAAIRLRRPLLVTGKPGTGKSTLAYSIAYELNLGPVLRWPITTRSTLQESLYQYDALARLQETSAGTAQPDIGKFIRLGPLGTALLPREWPRVLLIDELDKSDIDLPNDLLTVFEEGQFDIPVLTRLVGDQDTAYVVPADGGARVTIERGLIQCREFPIVVITDNGEREFPPPFLRRCLRLTIPPPDQEKLARIVRARLDLTAELQTEVDQLIAAFVGRRDGAEQQELATDQLLNAVYLVTQGVNPLGRESLLRILFRPLSGTSPDIQ